MTDLLDIDLPEGGPTEGADVGRLPGGLSAALEAILMVTDEPVSERELANAVVRSASDVGAARQRHADEYDEHHRGFELRRTVGGWRLYSRQDFVGVVERFVVDATPPRLSRAALETLAIVAYRQPVTRQTISSIRGVSSDAVLKTLQSRALVVEVGTDPATGAVLFGAGTLLYERLGIASVTDLPPLAPYLPDLADVIDADDPMDGRSR